ncbi:putative late blight resistance protein homolog R1A-3 isoform X8 [Solanum stenotomum]|uniref:putative late blight resistance protein homolog R1A-3 isoform X8 n=1 Tax=Solanum stenotomum TaxID=172797 RepID=UPI0020D101DA|nr:putative late blight resistance protein homolog R1A-3 isoform X8 [Solanum stenotomum]
MEKEGKPSELRLEEKRRRIRNLIDDLLNGLKKIENEEEVCSSFIYSKWGVIKPRISYFIWDVIKKLRMNLRFLRTFVLFGNSSFDHNFYEWMSKKINTFSVMTQALFCQVNEVILEKHNMDSLVPLLLEEMESYLRLKNSNYVAMITEEKMFEYLFTNLHDLPNYSSDMFEYLRCRTDYNIFRQVFRRLTDFYPILLANKTTTTQYLFPRFQFIAQTVMQFYFDIWTEKYKLRYGDDACASKITSLLIDIIPLELEVLDISTSNLIKESTSRELKRFVKQIVKSSPRILQNCLIHLQGRMAGAVNYAPTQSINVMIEFLLIFLTDIPKRFIHPDKLNDMLAHVGLLARKISILMEESSENNINEADFTAPDLLQEIERMKGDIKQNFLKAPESSQLRFPMDDGFLFMNLLLRHLNDLLISNAYSVSLIKKEIGMVKESLEFIRSSFKKVRQILDDCTSGVVKDCWLRALDVAYEAEHVINSILVRDKALSHLLFSLPNVTDKIKLIVAEVTCLQLEDKNGDDPLDAKSSDKPIESTSSSFVEVTVGHEEDEAKMIAQLLDKHESELDVISIVGMPGLGKTTLANKVYNNTKVTTHFNVRARCTVSQKCNKSKVLGEILQQVTGSEGKESEDDLAEKLRVALYDKRYLIVLDDVWDIATGEMLLACFPQVERGNRVILTSRSSEVGLKVKCHSDPLHLQLLTPEKSWELFEKRVFGEGSCPAELSEVGHKIVEKCQGLPLALVLIAGVIVRVRKGKKKEKDLWLKIQHNLDSFISANISLQMMKVMQLSYDHLPYHLRPLLLYFARSRKSKRTPVSKLMQLWMAEGFVNHDIPSKCSLEEVTQSYLDALISSSLIMVDHILSKKSMPFSVRIKVCYVHDVVHDFCSVKAKKEKFLKLINPGARFHTSDFLHHRLTIHTENGQLHKKCVLFNSKKCSAGSKHLISLKVSGSPLNLFRYVCHTRPFGLVRVLQLDSIDLKDSLMEEIGSLFHLRFLRIHTLDVKAIPVSWLNLQNLETLLINTGSSTMVLLPRIFKLSKLKHVKIDTSSFFEEEEEEDNIQSRILEGENSKLTTLSHVYISYSEGTNDALKKFPNLQHLECTIRIPEDPPTHGDWFPKFDVLNKLESLLVEYRWKDSVYPNEYHFPSSLKELRLCWFTMTPALLSAIAELPQLEILEFIDSDFVEDKWDASEDTYQSLETLTFREVNLSEWQVDRETFPKLEELILKKCYQLTEIPSVFGDIDTLKSIQVVQSKREIGDSAMEIKKDVAAYTGEDRLQVHIS